MKFTVPQFIEYEPKIVGPLTFKQFTYLGIAAVACFFFYFTVSFTLFLLSCLVLGGIASAFAFLKIGGRPFITFIGNFLKYILSPRMYLWKKKEAQARISTTKAIPEDELPLKIAEGSQLKNIKTNIETKTK